jgi:hypothetical protein
VIRSAARSAARRPRRAALARAVAGALALLGVLVLAGQALAVDRISQMPGFNARAWTITPPDADGVRYVGGDFTSYKAWQTGKGVAVDAATGAVDARFPAIDGWPYAETVVPDGSGGWYVSGGISGVGGAGVSRVAHLNPDGSLDAAWTPTVSGGQGVWAMAKVGDTILIGGDFTSVNGQPRTRLAAIGTDGTLRSWAPAANSTVHAIAVHGDTAYIGGQFGQLAGQSRGLAGSVRLGARTGGATGTCVDDWDDADCLTAWNPNAGGWGVKQIVTDGSAVYLGGAVTSIGGQSRGSLGKVDATSGAVASWNPQLNSEAEALALSGGTLYVGGLFTQAAGQARGHAAAFDTSTDALTGWDPDVTGNTVKGISVQGSTIYLAGRFSAVGSQVRSHAAAVDAGGTPTAWDPHLCDQPNGASSYAYGIAATPTQVYLLGDFPCAGGEKRMHAAGVGADGILTDWAPAVDGPVYSFSSSGGTIYMAGNFLNVDGTARTRAAAVTTAGALTAWAPEPGGDRPVSVVATPSRVYLGGFFSTMGGVARPALAAVDPATGALEASFDANVGGPIRAMALSGGRLYVGGDFSTVGGVGRDHIAAVDATTGALDTGWTAGALGAVHGRGIYVEAVATRGSRVFVGGSFNSVGGVTRNYAAALDAATGALDTTWAPPLVVGHNGNGDVYAIAPTDSAIYLGGQSDMSASQGGTTRQGVAAVHPTTGALTSWSANTGEVRGISASDAAVYLAGSFSTVGGVSRPNTAAVGTDGTVLDPWPMDQATTRPLVVTVAGASPGRVLSTPGGINCGDSCQYGFPTGATVTLEATDPGGDSDFAGWGGACSGTGPTCVVTVSASTAVTATFAAAGTTPGPAPSPAPDPSRPAEHGTGAPAPPDATAPDDRFAWRESEPTTRRRVLGSQRRTVLTERVRLALPGRYTLIHLDAAGRRVPLARGTRIAGRDLRRVSSAPVMRLRGPDSLSISAVLARPGARAVTLRVILREPDGRLRGRDLPLR